jgi:hypothetical protein
LVASRRSCLIVALIFTGFGLAGWMLTRQLVDLATKLPEYKGQYHR